LSAPFHIWMLGHLYGTLTEICSGQGNVPIELAKFVVKSLGLEIQICPHFSKFATDESFSSKSSSRSWYSANAGCD
jgi:hypothetical protein